MDAEVLGELHRRLVVTDAVHVVQRQTGVVERLSHHLRLKRATPEVELTGWRGGVGDANDRAGPP